MNSPASIQLKRVFPRISADLEALYASAVDNGGLTHLDVLTLRDLLEISGYESEEVLHAALIVMLLSLREGSVCTEVAGASLTRRFDGLVSPQKASEWAEKIVSALSGDTFSRLIATAESADKPVIRSAAQGRTLLYFQKYLFHERSFESALKQRLAMPPETVDIQKLKKIIDELLEADSVIRLNREQKLALGLALLRRFVVVCGGPGTGKTTLVFTVLQGLLRLGLSSDRIALAAPTGRAAQRLTESLNTRTEGTHEGRRLPPAQTLHRLLDYSSWQGFRRHRENPIQADVVVIDEVSMIDIVTMARLLDAVPPDARIILLGDKDQLPSVDAGSVLADLAPATGDPAYSAGLRKQLHQLFPDITVSKPDSAASEIDHVVLLRENRRSHPKICEVSERVNRSTRHTAEHLVAELPRTTAEESSLTESDGCWLCELTEPRPEPWRRVLDRWAMRHYLSPLNGGLNYMELAEHAAAAKNLSAPEIAPHLDALFEVLNSARVLTLLRGGPWGCEGVNRHIAEALMPGARAVLFSGAPVLITANDYVQQLFNGDVGIALAVPDRGVRVIFQRHASTTERYLEIPLSALKSFEYAFALTVHKSQGSEYGEILLPIPPQGAERLMNKQMIYTALTRAKRRAVFCGSAERLAAGIARRLDRHSGLSAPVAAEGAAPIAQQGLLF